MFIPNTQSTHARLRTTGLDEVPIDEYPRQGTIIVKIRIAQVNLICFASENKDGLAQTTLAADV